MRIGETSQHGLRIGCDRAFAGDSTEAAKGLIVDEKLDYLCYDRLAERTLSNAMHRRREDESNGNTRGREPWFERVLPECLPRADDHFLWPDSVACDPDGDLYFTVTQLYRALGYTKCKEESSRPFNLFQLNSLAPYQLDGASTFNRLCPKLLRIENRVRLHTSLTKYR